jgi:hypothetical protein|uniref:Uncharacterized protein n=1 Tax=Leptospirillum ferrodiazotrophum TaxID=412449 RepID=C6HXX0_9BACT|nr:MAG: protein of unknown function [Leptospirillum ferrodiazotrophum]
MMMFHRLTKILPEGSLHGFSPVPLLTPFMFSLFSLCLFFSPSPAHADEILDTVHSHYREQIQRIRDSLERDKDEAEQKEALADARRTVRWVFEEPGAAALEARIINRKVSKEFFQLGIPVIIHPVPARPFLLQRFTDHSIRVTNFEKGTILVKTSIPYLQDGGMKKARTEAILLAALLLRDQVLFLPVREKFLLKRDLPPEALLPNGPLAMTILNRAITPSGFKVQTLPLAAGGGIVLVRMEIPIPLHLGGQMATKISNLSFSSNLPIQKRRYRQTLPTGLILDARHLRISPFRDIILASDEGYILMKPDEGRDSGALPLGWAAFTDTLTPTLLLERVGPHPLTVQPDELVHRQVFLLPQVEARKVAFLFSGTTLLSTGHILIRLAPGKSLPPHTISHTMPRRKK